MVAPSAVADTVTPPIRSPEAAAMLPDRIASAARAGVRLVVETSAASKAANVRFAGRMTCLRWCASFLIDLVLRRREAPSRRTGHRRGAVPAAHPSRRPHAGRL